MQPSSEVDEFGLVRIVPRSLHLSRGADGAIVLTRTGRYVRVGGATWRLLEALASAPVGLPVCYVRREHPCVDLGSLISRGVVEYQPPSGGAVGGALIAKLWRGNLRWRVRLRVWGWDAMAPLLRQSPSWMEDAEVSRPAEFDQVEAAARASLALPGTSAKCTVVAAAIRDCLIDLGYPARVVLLGSAEQFLFHARAYVHHHPVDAADTLVDLEPFRSFLTAPQERPTVAVSHPIRRMGGEQASPQAPHQ